MEKIAPRAKLTLSDICYDFGFTTRQGVHQRADIGYLVYSLEGAKKTLMNKYKYDLDNIKKRKKLPYSVISFIYKYLQG
jgi:hypothetical protein